MIELLHKNEKIWNMSYDNDTEAGIALGLYIVLSRLNNTKYSIKLNGIHYIISQSKSYTIITDYLVYYNVTKDFNLSIVNLDKEKYYISVLNDQNNYNIYSFQFPNFLRGFISGISHFDLDFRDFMFALPYKYDNNGAKIYYYIDGYDCGWISPLNETPPEPFTLEMS